MGKSVGQAAWPSQTQGELLQKHSSCSSFGIQKMECWMPKPCKTSQHDRTCITNVLKFVEQHPNYLIRTPSHMQSTPNPTLKRNSIPKLWDVFTSTSSTYTFLIHLVPPISSWHPKEHRIRTPSMQSTPKPEKKLNSEAMRRFTSTYTLGVKDYKKNGL